MVDIVARQRSLVEKVAKALGKTTTDVAVPALAEIIAVILVDGSVDQSHLLLGLSAVQDMISKMAILHWQDICAQEVMKDA